jgi:Zn-dependent peptidase ImmA (M78 family)
VNKQEYYEDLKRLARDIRVEYGFTSPRVLRSDLRKIYKNLGIRIDFSDSLKNVRGAYFNDPTMGPSVLLNRNIPADPMVFTMGHELKHHLKDQDHFLSFCDKSNQNETLEIGAEIFSAELIFPEQAFLQWMEKKGVKAGDCAATTLIHLKMQTHTTLSYTGLAKRAEFLKMCKPGALNGIRWKKLEESIYGIPFYKRSLSRI